MGNVNRKNISDKFKQWRVFNTSTGEEVDSNVIVMNPLEGQAALAALFTNARVTPDTRVGFEIWEWIKQDTSV